MKIKIGPNEPLEIDSSEVYVKGVGGYDGTNPSSASTLQDAIENFVTYDNGVFIFG